MIPYLSEFLDWLNKQPGGTQSIVGIFIVIGLGLLGKMLTWISSQSWKALTRVTARWIESRAPIVAPRTRIGLYDHVINASQAFSRAQKTTDDVTQQNERITAKLTRHAEIVGQQTDFKKRRQALAAFVRDVRPDVVSFGKIAGRLSDDTALIVSSYRSVFTKVQINTFADKMYLLSQRDQFRQLSAGVETAITGFGKMYASMSGLVDLAPELGQAYEATVVKLLDSLKSLNAFCKTEVPRIVNHRVGLTSRMWYIVRRSWHQAAAHTEAPS